VVVVLPALAIASSAQADYWRDGVTLFQHAVDVTGDNALAQHNLGFALAARGGGFGQSCASGAPAPRGAGSGR